MMHRMYKEKDSNGYAFLLTPAKDGSSNRFLFYNKLTKSIEDSERGIEIVKEFYNEEVNDLPQSFKHIITQKIFEQELI